MKVGTLINYPLCMLGDLEKYKDFVGRGCPTKSGHRFSINSNGQTHGCVMEDKDYGNVYEVGLKEAYSKTMAWRDETYLYEGCKGCHYIDVCQSGCRMHGMAATGKMNQKDPLMPGKEFIVKPYKLEKDTFIEKKISSGASLFVPKSIRFRYEKEENLEEGPKLNRKEIPTGEDKPRIKLNRKEIPTGEDKPRIKLNRKEIPTGEEIEEELATPQQLDLISLKSNIIRAAQSFTNKEDLENHILGLIDGIDDDLFDMEIEVDLFDKR